MTTNWRGPHTAEIASLRADASLQTRLAAMLDRTALRHYDDRDRKVPGAFCRASNCDTGIAAANLTAAKLRREANRLDLSNYPPRDVAELWASIGGRR